MSKYTKILKACGVSSKNVGVTGRKAYPNLTSGIVTARTPIDCSTLASVSTTSKEGYAQVLKDSIETFNEWRVVPAPRRGEIVRQIAEEIRQQKTALGKLVSLETGKIVAEGEGEIQEVIDIADFAVGLSRQLYGKTMHSERPGHRMYEQWHPLGPVGVITAFNFPAAVWAWNAMIAAVCGDTIIWKPSEWTTLTAVAINKICQTVAARNGFPGLFSLIVGDGPEVGKWLAQDTRIPLISATGSCAMGRSVGEVVARRLGRVLLELGGNNAVTILKDADLELAIPAVVFGAVGTAGQRCTSTRRVYVAQEIESDFIARLSRAYQQVRIGNPLESGTLMGPLIHQGAMAAFEKAIKKIKANKKCTIICGGKRALKKESSLYVEPTIVSVPQDFPLLKEETFAPLLYVVGVTGIDQAIALQNDVPQGLSSAIFTRSLQSSERFLSVMGSDCGIANVNIGTSGAEIGGAFGGEKDTGGGREAGSDSWKQYMRRQTSTINFSNDLPLAQGIKFS